MNKTISDFTRQQLKDGLAQCTEKQQHLFKQMYCHKSLELPINAAVDAMPDDKLDWALSQVEKTLTKNAA